MMSGNETNNSHNELGKTISNLLVVQGKHEVRLNTLEKLIENQTKVLTSMEKKLTVIGTALVLVVGASSEAGGNVLRALLGM
jgi:hypothetical protein